MIALLQERYSLTLCEYRLSNVGLCRPALQCRQCRRSMLDVAEEYILSIWIRALLPF